MTPQDVETLSRVTASAAKAAVAEGNLPLIERLGRIEGTLGLGAQRMDGLDRDITDHEKRLDGHDSDHKEHREALALLRQRARDERSPARGNPALEAKVDSLAYWKRELLGVLIRWGIPVVIFLIIFAIEHGAKIPLFT